MRLHVARFGPVLVGFGLVSALLTAVTLPRPGRSPIAAIASQAPIGSGPQSTTTASEAPLGAGPVPVVLPGGWNAVANGDRIRQLSRSGGELWSATSGGVVRWSLADGGYRQFLAPQDGLPSSDVRALTRDRSGRLWAATARGLARFDPDDGRWVAVAGPPTLGSNATALALAPDGGLWAGFQQRWDPAAAGPDGAAGNFAGGGLARLNPVTERWDQVYQAEVDPVRAWRTIPSNNVTALAVASDGRLWVGTMPFFVWTTDSCGAPPCLVPTRLGGGLAASNLATGEWARWGGTDLDSCMADRVNGLAADSAGRMWVATQGKGLHVFRDGLATVACGAGHSSYRDSKGGQPLPGTKVWAVAVGDDGRVYTGVGSEHGQGIAVLEHHGSFGDTDTDDDWNSLGLDGIAGPHDAIVSALWVGGGELIAGTLDSWDQRDADGYGVKIREPNGQWRTLATAAEGLPSNRVSVVAVQPGSSNTWFGTAGRGVARWDGHAWVSWRAFGRDQLAARLAVTSTTRATELVLGLSREAYLAAFPGQLAKARLGPDDSVLYELYNPVAVPGSPAATRVQVFPPPEAALPAGYPVFTVSRGAAGDDVTGLAFDAGGAWLAARPTLGRRANPAFGQTDCDNSPQTSAPDCRWDGGLGRWDGNQWAAYEPKVGELPSRDVQALALDLQGKVWLGTGGSFGDSGQGAAVLDPGSGDWTHYKRAAQGAGFGFDNVTALGLDPVMGTMWLASQGKPDCATPAEPRKCLDIAGAVSRFQPSREGGTWTSWSHSAKPPAPGLSEQGAHTALLFDRPHARVWVGGWQRETNFHWNEGVGMTASVDFCPRNCEPGSWQGERFDGDGAVYALALDGTNRLWAGGHRNGHGLVPPTGGLRILDGDAWTLHTTASAPLPSDNITALGPSGPAMWLGTWESGAIQWRPAVLPHKTYLPTARK
jgi:ligand-binding sensor domain-containing protein